MGNCTSKKSSKLAKLGILKKPGPPAMDGKELLRPKGETRGLSTKIAPCSKGQATSFGFKRRPASALPVPVTLTSRVDEIRQDVDSSSVESLCHVATQSTSVLPKTSGSSTDKTTQRPGSKSGISGGVTVNRFGFRSATPPRVSRASDMSPPPKSPAAGSTKSINKSPNTRSRSEGPRRCPREAREAFFKDLQPSGSMQSISDGGKLINGQHPSRFTLQTSQLPRPQFPVRVSDKTFKTVTNYCRRDGPNESGSSKEPSLTEDSGVYSQPSNNTLGETDTLHGLELVESIPAPIQRSRSVNARKLELKMINNNKFELLEKENLQKENEVELVKPPRSNICTGLVQQRTEQYLQRLAGARDSNRQLQNAGSPSSPQAIESEEEKAKKDATKSEKSTVTYLMSEGIGENDEMLPGEAMADDISLSISSDEELSCLGKKTNPPLGINLDDHGKGSAIRVDALKISHQLKKTDTSQGEDSCFGLLNTEERIALEEDTLLELSSESDSSGEKAGNDAQKEVDPLNGSTESPGTPSNASLSEGRDFLIDDEIADQPQLCFSTHEEVNADRVTTASGNNNGSEGTVLYNNLDDLKAVKPKEARRSSVGTLSPCESLMSDDLMMDFESSTTDDMPAKCETNGMMVNAEFDADLKDCSTFPRTRLRNGSDRGCGRANSAGSSPASMRSVASRVSTDEDLSVRLDKSSYQNMFQDIVSIKTMLLKLNRLLSESDGNFPTYSEDDANMDLRKQVAFLQQQLQQRETTVSCLQAEVNRNVDCRTQSVAPTLCNAATQTDRARPVSTGPSIIQNLPSDTNSVSNKMQRTSSESSSENNRQCVERTAPADKIMEKVKQLSFKPVEVMERERMSSGKNVFKITKIDLVLKSDNYGQSEITARR